MLEAIPQELRDIPRWVAYRLEQRKPGKKPTKVPVCPRTGELASTTDPSSWDTFDHAVMRARATGMAGVGFVFTNDDDILGVDLDRCRDPESGKLEDWAQSIVDGLASYSEVSPSGTGIHVIARGSLPKKGRCQGNFEIYERARFFVMTGEHVEGTPRTVKARHEQVLVLHAAVFGPQRGGSKAVATEPQPRP